MFIPIPGLAIDITQNSFGLPSDAPEEKRRSNVSRERDRPAKCLAGRTRTRCGLRISDRRDISAASIQAHRAGGVGRPHPLVRLPQPGVTYFSSPTSCSIGCTFGSLHHFFNDHARINAYNFFVFYFLPRRISPAPLPDKSALVGRVQTFDSPLCHGPKLSL